MKWRRVLRMGPAEIACRGRQALSRHAGRWLSACWPGSAPDYPPLSDIGVCRRARAAWRAGRREEAAGLLRRQVEEALPSRFFAGLDDDAVLPLLAADESYRKEVTDAASALARGEFSILGHGRLHFGAKVDWHADPLRGTSAPRRHWSRLNPLDPAEVGDSKVVWELNRHQWLLDLGQAWRLSGDDRHAELALRLLRDWMRDNPPGQGINWSSSLEVAMRLIARSWALVLFRGARALDDATYVEMLAWIGRHARYIDRYLSHYFAPNTHLSGEALGLFYAGCLFPELAGASTWRRRGAEILEAQIPRQVHEDGVYFEQSTCYQYYTIEIALHYLLLAQRAGHAVPAVVEARLQAMMDFVLALRRPDGLLPQIGDADGGWLLPLLRRAPGDFSALFSSAALLLRRADLAWAAGTLAPESLWLLGSGAAADFAELDPAPPDNAEPRLFRQGGYAVLRSGWTAAAHQLIFDIGPLGHYGHGHADLLSIQLSAHGQPYLIDPGTGTYTADPAWREHFRHSAAHNTLSLDGRSQAEASGPFNWRQSVSAVLEHFERGPEHELIVASHDAWAGVRHRRRVYLGASGIGLLVDDLEGSDAAVHEVCQHFQFAALPVVREGAWWRARGPRGDGLLLRSLTLSPLSESLHQGEQRPLAGWISPNYGCIEVAPALALRTQARLPLRLVTLLLPLADGRAAAPALHTETAQGRIVALTVATAAGTERLVIGPDTVTREARPAAAPVQA